MNATNGEYKDSLAVGHTSLGVELHAQVVRLGRFSAVLEIYNPSLVIRTSEVLSGFQMMLRDRAIYSGRAVVRSLVHAGAVTVCEVQLDEASWRDVEFTLQMLHDGTLRGQFQDFLQQWQKCYQLLPEYKIVIADMHSYLSSLRLWVDQVELGIRATPAGDRGRLEQEVTAELAQPVLPCIDVFFEQFENTAKRLEEASVPAHRNYMRRQLHPLVLCSPFAYRTFEKPLGYAGDYEMVNMILRNQPEGGSLFAKVVNTWFLRQPPAEAHRNRIADLANTLEAEVLRTQRAKRPARIFSVACGPAQEVQRFLEQTPLSDHAHITLLDFNEETLQYGRSVITAARKKFGRRTVLEYVRKSVQQILKESGRTVARPEKQYDFVYCAGLFDYLSDQICQRLMTVMYEWLAPGGLLLATNVEPSNPLRHGMEHLLDWHLIYRNSAQMLPLAPSQVGSEACVVRTDATGVNLFLQVRKPEHD